MIKFIIIIFIFISSTLVSAQQYMYEAQIKKNKESGFYKIYLTPDISSRLQQNFPDIRIENNDGEEIPFIYGLDWAYTDSTSKTELKILKNKHKKFKRIANIIVENDSLKSIDNFILKIPNKGLKNKLKISGSYDQKQWYEIKKNFSVQAAYSDSATTELVITNIPTTGFNFYQFIFNDYKDESVEVIKVYAISKPDVDKEYFELVKPFISHKDTLDKTIISLKFTSSYFIDKISFRIKGSRYYLRRANIYKEINNVHNTGGVLYFDDISKEFFLGSDRNNTIILPRFKTKNLKLVVDNKDNIPIRVVDVNAYQLKNYIITYLKRGKSYKLKFGKPMAEFPVYDLSYFKESVPKEIPVIELLNTKRVYYGKNSEKANLVWNIPTYYLWIGISIVGIILIYLTTRMIIERYRKGELE